MNANICSYGICNHDRCLNANKCTINIIFVLASVISFCVNNFQVTHPRSGILSSNHVCCQLQSMSIMTVYLSHVYYFPGVKYAKLCLNIRNGHLASPAAALHMRRIHRAGLISALIIIGAPSEYISEDDDDPRDSNTRLCFNFWFSSCHLCSWQLSQGLLSSVHMILHRNPHYTVFGTLVSFQQYQDQRDTIFCLKSFGGLRSSFRSSGRFCTSPCTSHS